eukprot:5494886-Prymnesium_polylepis.1
MADFLFTFRDTEKDAGNSRARIRERLRERRSARRRSDTKWREAHGRESPLKALPGVIAFFVRTVQMLQGLCTLFQARERAARERAVRERAPRERA